MIEVVRYSVNGTREVLERVLFASRARGGVKDYPACSALFAEVERGTPEETRIEDELSKYGLRSSKMSFYFPTDEELRSSTYFRGTAVGWTDEVDDVLAKPAYSGCDACPECGKGSVELAAPLRVHSSKLDLPLLRYPPALFLGSTQLVELARREGWTGVKSRPVIERKMDKESDRYHQLIITSILPPMHVSSALIRSPIPKFCEVCGRLGYKLPQPQPVYSTGVMDLAKDWNISKEWASEHFVSVPFLICSRRVVHALLKLDPDQVWLPVKFVE